MFGGNTAEVYLGSGEREVHNPIGPLSPRPMRRQVSPPTYVKIEGRKEESRASTGTFRWLAPDLRKDNYGVKTTRVAMSPERSFPQTSIRHEQQVHDGKEPIYPANCAPTFSRGLTTRMRPPDDTRKLQALLSPKDAGGQEYYRTKQEYSNKPLTSRNAEQETDQLHPHTRLKRGFVEPPQKLPRRSARGSVHESTGVSENVSPSLHLQYKVEGSQKTTRRASSQGPSIAGMELGSQKLGSQMLGNMELASQQMSRKSPRGSIDENMEPVHLTTREKEQRDKDKLTRPEVSRRISSTMQNHLEQVHPINTRGNIFPDYNAAPSPLNSARRSNIVCATTGDRVEDITQHEQRATNDARRVLHYGSSGVLKDMHRSSGSGNTPQWIPSHHLDYRHGRFGEDVGSVNRDSARAVFARNARSLSPTSLLQIRSLRTSVGLTGKIGSPRWISGNLDKKWATKRDKERKNFVDVGTRLYQQAIGNMRATRRGSHQFGNNEDIYDVPKENAAGAIASDVRKLSPRQKGVMDAKVIDVKPAAYNAKQQTQRDIFEDKSHPDAKYQIDPLDKAFGTTALESPRVFLTPRVDDGPARRERAQKTRDEYSEQQNQLRARLAAEKRDHLYYLQYAKDDVTKEYETALSPRHHPDSGTHMGTFVFDLDNRLSPRQSAKSAAANNRNETRDEESDSGNAAVNGKIPSKEEKPWNPSLKGLTRDSRNLQGKSFLYYDSDNEEDGGQQADALVPQSMQSILVPKPGGVALAKKRELGQWHETTYGTQWTLDQAGGEMVNETQVAGKNYGEGVPKGKKQVRGFVRLTDSDRTNEPASQVTRYSRNSYPDSQVTGYSNFRSIAYRRTDSDLRDDRDSVRSNGPVSGPGPQCRRSDRRSTNYIIQKYENAKRVGNRPDDEEDWEEEVANKMSMRSAGAEVNKALEESVNRFDNDNRRIYSRAATADEFQKEEGGRWHPNFEVPHYDAPIQSNQGSSKCEKRHYRTLTREMTHENVGDARPTRFLEKQFNVVAEEQLPSSRPNFDFPDSTYTQAIPESKAGEQTYSATELQDNPKSQNTTEESNTKNFQKEEARFHLSQGGGIYVQGHDPARDAGLSVREVGSSYPANLRPSNLGVRPSAHPSDIVLTSTSEMPHIPSYEARDVGQDTTARGKNDPQVHGGPERTSHKDPPHDAFSEFTNNLRGDVTKQSIDEVGRKGKVFERELDGHRNGSPGVRRCLVESEAQNRFDVARIPGCKRDFSKDSDTTHLQERQYLSPVVLDERLPTSRAYGSSAQVRSAAAPNPVHDTSIAMLPEDFVRANDGGSAMYPSHSGSTRRYDSGYQPEDRESSRGVQESTRADDSQTLKAKIRGSRAYGCKRDDLHCNDVRPAGKRSNLRTRQYGGKFVDKKDAARAEFDHKVHDYAMKHYGVDLNLAHANLKRDIIHNFREQVPHMIEAYHHDKAYRRSIVTGVPSENPGAPPQIHGDPAQQVPGDSYNGSLDGAPHQLANGNRNRFVNNATYDGTGIQGMPLTDLKPVDPKRDTISAGKHSGCNYALFYAGSPVFKTKGNRTQTDPWTDVQASPRSCLPQRPQIVPIAMRGPTVALEKHLANEVQMRDQVVPPPKAAPFGDDDDKNTKMTAKSGRVSDPTARGGNLEALFDNINNENTAVKTTLSSRGRAVFQESRQRGLFRSPNRDGSDCPDPKAITRPAGEVGRAELGAVSPRSNKAVWALDYDLPGKPPIDSSNNTWSDHYRSSKSPKPLLAKAEAEVNPKAITSPRQSYSLEKPGY